MAGPPDLEAINQLTSRIIGAAMEVHTELGPGLYESVYHRCLMVELRRAGMTFETEVPVPVVYKGELITTEGYKIDLMVDGVAVVELKSVAAIKPVHKKQLLTYLRLMKKPVGLLINFNVARLRDGIHRVIDFEWLERQSKRQSNSADRGGCTS